MNVTPIRCTDPNAPARFVKSLTETGFAVLTDHPIPTDLISDAFAEWAAFFASDEKHAHRFDPKVQAGYFPFRSENAKDSKLKDLKEFFHYYPDRGALPTAAQVKTPELYRQLSELGSQLLGWIEEGSPSEVRARFSEPLRGMIQGSEETLLRILHYPPLTGTEEEGAIRAAAHEDINLITLLPAATAPGLEVQDLEGKWHAVECDPGMIVINSGDMLKEASRGHYPSTTHRVKNPSGEAARRSRYSMPLFVHARRDARLSERFTAREYLRERLKEIGLL